MGCGEKKKYRSRIAAESALSVARSQWWRDPSRAEVPPHRIYLCPDCGAWHLTHASERAAGRWYSS